MDSAKIFALGLAVGLAIHVFVRNGARKGAKHAQQAAAPPSPSIASKPAKKNKNKKNKNKDSPTPPSTEAVAAPAAPAPAPAPEPVAKPVESAPAATTSKKNKKNKKQHPQPNAQATTPAESYAEVAAADDAAPAKEAVSNDAISNDAVRARSDAAQAALVASLGDMRDADVDELPAGYSSVARIPASEPAATHRISRKDQDDGWSSVGGTFPSSSRASASSAKPNGTATHTSFASTNPFAALPDDAPTASVKRLPSKPSAPSGGGWTVAPPGPVKTRANGAASVVGAGGETKKQRSNANKAAAKKAAKEDAERLQAERLANHRRQQALEAAQQRDAARRPAPHSVSAKTPTAKASVDLNGRLVWD